jgi:DNA-binding NarL/FixJ family response regulator
LGRVLMCQATSRAPQRTRRAGQALEQIGAEPPKPRPGGFSPREADVLQLAARGLSNEDIATALVLSARTVERHVANAYAKIGASGRTARAIATAWAHPHAHTQRRQTNWVFTTPRKPFEAPNSTVRRA